MTFNDESAKALASGDIGVGYLIDANGTVYWQVGEWEGFNPAYVFAEWQKTGMSAIQVGNLKFTTLRKDPNTLVTTNVGGNGNLIGCSTDNWPGGYLICWTPNTLQPDVAFSIVKKLANLVRS